MSDQLTQAQRAALDHFERDTFSTAFPNVNPRTASALWSKGLIRGQVLEGKRYYQLTELGEELRRRHAV